MPNYCENQLYVVAPSNERMDVFLDFVGSHIPLDFDRIIPAPKGLFHGAVGKKEKEKYKNTNWYDWNNKKWGTKWNAEDVRVEREGKTAYFSFDTAWSPPLPVIDELMDIFDDFTFSLEYYEPGVGYAGVYGTHEDREFSEEEIVNMECERYPEHFINNMELYAHDPFYIRIFDEYGHEELAREAEEYRNTMYWVDLVRCDTGEVVETHAVGVDEPMDARTAKIHAEMVRSGRYIIKIREKR